MKRSRGETTSFAKEQEVGKEINTEKIQWEGNYI